MNLSRYDFNLPSQLIADRPRKPRGTSRLLVVDKESGHCVYSLGKVLLCKRK